MHNHTEIVVIDIHANNTIHNNLIYKPNNITLNTYELNPRNNTDHHTEDFILDYAIEIYTGLIVLTIILTFMRSIMFVMACMRSSINLHNTMFHNLLQSFMRFFDTNPSGRILNRFSKDMGIMDEVIPKAMLEAIQV